MSSVPDRSISTGKSRTNATSAARPIEAKGKRSRWASARKNPSPIPRKLARRMKFEKYERYRMLDPVHRMRASSTKSIRKLRASMRALNAPVRPLTIPLRMCDQARMGPPPPVALMAARDIVREGDGWVNWSGLATAIEELLQVYLQGLQALLNLEKTLATTRVSRAQTGSAWLPASRRRQAVAPHALCEAILGEPFRHRPWFLDRPCAHLHSDAV